MKNAPLTRTEDRVELDCAPGGKISFSGKEIRTAFIRLGLGGAHQILNAGLAVATLDVLLERKTFTARFRRLNSAAVARGLSRVRQNTGLHGRMAAVGRNRRFILDVAHNQDGMHTAVSSLMGAGMGNFTAVFGVMKDKAYLPMLKQLGWVADMIITVRPHTARAASASVLCKAARRMGLQAIEGGRVSEGLKKAMRRQGRILVTGSHYVVGEALEFLGKKKP